MNVLPLLILAASLGGDKAALPVDYPETHQVDQVDTYHGHEVADPYRWLEEDVRQSPRVRDWVERQNQVTRKYLDSLPERKAIHGRLTQLWDYPKYSTPRQIGGKYFFQKNDGLQNQAVLYVAEAPDAPPRRLIDPNSWSDDGTVALATTFPSDDGQLLAYTVSSAGSDWKTLHVLDVATGEPLQDRLQWVRWGNVQWLPDRSGFYYARYPQPKPGEQYQALALDQAIYLHQLGTPQADDLLLYARPDHPDWTFFLTLTEDDRYLVLEITKSTDNQNRLYVRPAQDDKAPWMPLIDDFDNEFAFVGNTDDTLFLLTDFQAPTRRLVAMDVHTPGRAHLREVIAASPETLRSARIIDQHFVASYLRDASSRVQIHSLDGKLVRNVSFPSLGTADGFSGRPEDTETFYSFSSYTVPPSIYRYDMRTGESHLWHRAEIQFDSEQYELKQVFYASKDGTRVPMFLAHRRGTTYDGARPTLLYGYGGFNIPLTPRFSIAYAVWMEMGGVVAIANLRGGGEYGESWHEAGKKLNKQNVFDDFIAAAHWLIDNRVTKPSRLGIQGGSNGGLLVGAAMTQQPQLFGACLPAVGVMDMLRYHRFTAGRFWVDEYGSVEDADEFRALLAYSPYHNLRPGVSYPATLISTADTDDRVVPMHSFKFAAALQHAQAGDAPVLIRIETAAGHGAGKPTAKRIDSVADQWAFLAHHLGLSERRER